LGRHSDFAHLIISHRNGIYFWLGKTGARGMRNFKRPRQNMAVVAMAGPVSNLLMAIFWALVARLGVMLGSEAVSVPLIYTGVAGISIDLVLALLNLLPIPPLDGVDAFRYSTQLFSLAVQST
jgi:Zn-dependent protease